MGVLTPEQVCGLGLRSVGENVRISDRSVIYDLIIRVIHHATGEIIRELTINPNKRYHCTGRPTGGPKVPRKPQRPNPQ